MKIAVFEAEERERNAFEKLKAKHNVVFVSEPLKPGMIRHTDADVISTFIYSEMGAAVIDQFPDLKLIATRSTGFEHIDAIRCKERDIAISNVPVYGSKTVAEHVFALLLSIGHRMPEAIARAQRGHFSPFGLQGFDLADKTFGVIGTGAIGRHVIQIARGFDMNVVAFDVRPDEAFAAQGGFKYVSQDELLAVSDIVTLHVPSMPSTHHLIREETIAKMKTGVVILNVSRGDLIETSALIQALTTGKIAAAGLDVLPDEPMIREEAQLINSIFGNENELRTLVANHILLRMRNVIITPHSAFNTKEAVDRIVGTTVDNISAYLAGNPQNIVQRKG
jgi:D-lactate dehydrogenase